MAIFDELEKHRSHLVFAKIELQEELKKIGKIIEEQQKNFVLKQ